MYKLLAQCAVSLLFLLVTAVGTIQAQSREPVIFFSGGTLDDQVVHMLLLSMENVDLRGIVVCNTDCISDFAMVGHWKVAQALGRTDIPLALSRAKGWNPFPYTYRKDSIQFIDIESLAPYPRHTDWPPFPSGDNLLEILLLRAVSAGEQITLLVTEPVTAVSDLLRRKPELEQGIKRMIFMGGAIDVPGNLDPSTLPKQIANQKAEWNIFWDPRSTQWLLSNTFFPIIMLPLDVTNEAKITDSFKRRLRSLAKDSLPARIASQAYGLIWNQPFYCLWNTAAASYLSEPELFEDPVEQRLQVVEYGFDQGSVVRAENGRVVQVVFNFKNVDAFYGVVLKLLGPN